MHHNHRRKLLELDNDFLLTPKSGLPFRRAPRMAVLRSFWSSTMDAMGARCSNHDQPECVLRLDPGALCDLLSGPVLGLIANFMPLVIYHNSEK